jgi:N-acetylmuramoyl-L-alanine amidase
MQPHVIQPGEHLLGLCARLGADPDEVWNASENSELRELRSDYNVLAPGDVVFLPEPSEEPLALDLHRTNRYQARVPTMPLALRLREGSEAIANEPFRIDCTEPPIEGTTGGDGSVDVELPATTAEATLILTGRNERLRLMVGHLDPTERTAGVRARLQNLGYFPAHPRPGPATPQARADELAHALRDFQRDRRLEVTGELDDNTRRALSEQHGA